MNDDRRLRKWEWGLKRMREGWRERLFEENWINDELNGMVFIVLKVNVL